MPQPRPPIASLDLVIGRDNLCSELVKSSLSSRIALLFGSRQAGKTAVLRHIVRTTQASRADVGILTDLDIPVYVDLMRLPHDAKPGDFFAFLARHAEDACIQRVRGFGTAALRTNNKADTSPEIFASDIQLLRQCAGEVNVRFIFLMDETKRILGDRFPRGFQDNLYALLFNPDLGVSDYIAFVFSGAQHLYQLSDDDTSPLGSRATSHVIENMSESDVHSFCTLVLPSSDQTRTDEFVTWLYGLTFGQAGLTAKALRMASELGSIESALDKRESLADELKTQSVGLVRNWASSFTDEARTVIVHFGSRTSVTQKEISRVLTEQKRDQYAADRVAEELLYTGAVINRHARLLKGNPLLWEYMDQYGKEDTGSEDEREAWNLIEEAELALREYVREKYQQEWPARAFEQMKIHLGIEEWNKLLDIQKRSIGKYAYSPSYTGRDEMSCMYLGQLLTLMIHGKAWPHFAHLFRDKRQLEDMMSAITPVRADRAHFTNVPEKELVRCKIACDDLLVILAK